MPPVHTPPKEEQEGHVRKDRRRIATEAKCDKSQ